MICQTSDDRAPSRRTTEAAAAPSAVTASANGVGWGRSGSNLGAKLTASLVATPRSSSDGTVALEPRTIGPAVSTLER